MPEPHDVVFFPTPAHLRKWFEAHHEKAGELWLGYHRKRTGRPSVTWKEVVDQCLCFGWIDSVRYSLNEESTAQRLTPRRKRSVWSAINVRRFGELERAGLVHPRGRAAFEARVPERTGIYSYEKRGVGLGPAFETRFRRERKAWEFFEAQANWYRRSASHWVVSAKREETRERRFVSLVEHSRKGERIPPLSTTPRAARP